MEQTFTVSLYNKKVRDTLERGDDEALVLDAGWANLHYIEVIAHSKGQARKRINAKYPPRQGFIIQEILLEKKYV